MFISVDVDDVLAQFNKFYFDHYNEKHGTSFTLEDHKQYYYDKTLGKDLQYHIDLMVNLYNEVPHNAIEPHDNAFEVLKKLSEKHELVAITARPEFAKERTLEWINTHFPDLFEDIHFTGQFHSKNIPKSEVCLEIGASVMIEDAFHHALDCAKALVRSHKSKLLGSDKVMLCQRLNQVNPFLICFCQRFCEAKELN